MNKDGGRSFIHQYVDMYIVLTFGLEQGTKYMLCRSNLVTFISVIFASLVLLKCSYSCLHFVSCSFCSMIAFIVLPSLRYSLYEHLWKISVNNHP